MAKILLGATIGDARGSAGAIVYSRNQFGAYIRQKVSPVQPQTNRQTTVRQLFTTLAIRWGSVLTDAQRAAWLALAASNPVVDVFGNSQIMTGLQLYMRVNRNLQECGITVIDAAPADQSVTPLASLSCAFTTSTQVVEVGFSPSPVPADHSLVVYATPPFSAGKAFFKPLLRLVEVFATAQASAADMSTLYLAKFGAFLEGQRIGVKAFQVNTTNGAASPDVFANKLAVA
ncbi:MAG: hypothetical protein Q8R28_04980 [Dehalococcoidia bacterium]|nr:hypothetical protein [Dehalococcoidia bacterium]